MAKAQPTYLDLDAMLTQATEARASDLHIRVGMPPMIRVDGALSPLEGHGPVTKEQSTELVRKSTTDDQRKTFFENKSLDMSRAVVGVARFRCAYFLQQSLISLVFRRIPDNIPSLADVKAPAILLEWARLPRGLVLVTGPTGSGKSTTLAAVLDVVNAERADHILTIEDPIEFVHQPKRCVVNQREIGRDAPNFAQALRAGLRQDPDIILVGELRDLETMATAITAAETGHLVFGTLHTSTADSTISRIIDQYPSDQQQQIRVMLAASLVGVVTQALLPRADGPGRIACHEVMVCNTAVRSHIRHQQMDQVRGVMQTQNKIGMQTMDRCLSYYVNLGVLAEDVARARAINIDEFEQTLTSFRRGQDVAIPQIVQPGQGSMFHGQAPGSAVAMPSAAARTSERAPLPAAETPPLPAAGLRMAMPGDDDSPSALRMSLSEDEALPSAAPVYVPDAPVKIDLAVAAQAAARADAALRAAHAASASPLPASSPPLPVSMGAPPLPVSSGGPPLPPEDESVAAPEESRFAHLFEGESEWAENEDLQPPVLD